MVPTDDAILKYDITGSKVTFPHTSWPSFRQPHIIYYKANINRRTETKVFGARQYALGTIQQWHARVVI